MQSKLETRVGIFVLVALGIFMYMGFQVGAFRFDTGRYASYKLHFDDISGLARKSEVKIAGVKVGWVEDLGLESNGTRQAHVNVKVLKDYRLYEDAYATVRQDGLLGPKYLEISPGDPHLPKLEYDSALGAPSVSPVSVDEIMQQFKNIAANVEDITGSLRGAMGGVEGQENVKAIFDNLNTTADRIASLSDIVDRAFIRNEDNIDALLEIGTNVKKVANRLDEEVLPSFKDSIEKISTVFDRDFDRVAGQLATTVQSFEDATLEAREGLRGMNSVIGKIDEGRGLLGKIVNEDETYYDIKVAAQGLRNYFAKVDMMQVVFDSHFETMHRPAENYCYEDSKGYFNVRIHPNEDHFYVVQFATSERGFIHRDEQRTEYCDGDKPVNPEDLDITDRTRLEFIYDVHREVTTRNTIKLGLQFGKVFKMMAFRFGLFEGTAGVGVDFDIPFDNENFRWVTSLEVFDTNGWNRSSSSSSRGRDRRPHLKWLNKIYIMRNIYMTFGADDFVSQRNANAFFGAGVRFSDDDVKYLMSGAGSMIGGIMG